MLGIKRSIATLAVSFGVLAAAGPASAEVIESIGTKYTMVDNAKNEISIESLEIVTPRFLPTSTTRSS